MWRGGAGWGVEDVGLLETPEPGGTGGSSGQPELENPGTAGHSSILRPPPRSLEPPAALSARSPPFHFRVCVGVCPGGGRARGRAGRRGGARSARRAESGGVLALGPFLRLLGREGGGGVRVAVRARGPVAPASPRHSPPHADTLSFLAAPPRWGWGTGAASPRERGERSSLARWAAGEQEQKLFPAAPRAWSLARVSPRGWELHLRPGREVRAGLWGAVGRGVG